MSGRKINRRQFLLLSGGALGAGTLACCGLTAAGSGLFDEAPQSFSMPDRSYGETFMNHKILVTYASQAGSTGGVADAVGQALSSKGAAVDVRPMTAVDDLSPYRAVVLGSAIHSGKWLPEAAAFIERHGNALGRMPNAVFQVCMMMATASEQYRHMAAGWLDPMQAQLKSVAAGSFSGALWPNQYPRLTDRLGLHIFLATVKLKAGDYRDWNSIRDWALNLYPLLRA